MARTFTYPWDSWLRRRRLLLERGLDYHCSSLSMAQQVRNAAAVRHLSVVIKESAEGLEITISRRPLTEAAPCQ
jgi:hypothetical protein